MSALPVVAVELAAEAKPTEAASAETPPAPAEAVLALPAPPIPEPVAAAPAAEAPPAPAAAPRPASLAPAESAPPVMPELADPILRLRSLTARVDGRTILKGLSFALGQRGVYALMGPGGSGKSSLAGILSGRNRAGSGWTFEGEIEFDGSPLGISSRPVVVGQKLARPSVTVRRYLLGDLDEVDASMYGDVALGSLLERVRLGRLRTQLDAVPGSAALAVSAGEYWRLAIARELIANPPLLCVDEPTAGLDADEAQPILELLRAEGERRAVLFITHNQTHAQVASDYTILLAGGQVQEFRSTVGFFSEPRSQAAKDYVRTGGCTIASPDTPAEHLESPYVPTDIEVPPELATLTTPPELPPALAAPVELPPVGAVPPAASPAPPEPPSVFWSCPAPILSLRGFALQVGSRFVISGISLDIERTGIYAIAVPSGSERRLFLRSLTGPRPNNFVLAGEAQYLGRPLRDENGPAAPQAGAQLVMMTVREYLASNLPGRAHLSRTEQRAQAVALLEHARLPELGAHFESTVLNLDGPERRMLEILRTAAAAPALMIFDDPLAGLSDGDRLRVKALLQRQAQHRAVLVLGAELDSLVDTGARLAWLVEGRLVASRPVGAPAAAVEVLPAGPSAAPERAAPQPSEPPAAAPVAIVEPSVTAVSRSSAGPRGFQWLTRGALAGMPAPGVTYDLGYDLELIRHTGVTYLVTLTTDPLPPETLAQHGLKSIYFPIIDMDAPAESAAADLCTRIERLLAQGEVVGFHCKAGLGRTGTMLAAQLIFGGMEARAALAKVRAVDPGWVQSDRQIQFLDRFAAWLHKQRTPAS